MAEMKEWGPVGSILKRGEALPAMRFRQARRDAGFTMNRAAKELGVSHMALALWERNEIIPKADIIYDMAVLYDTSADYLLGLSERK